MSLHLKPERTQIVYEIQSMKFSPKFNIQTAALGLALLLGVHTLWVLAAELLRRDVGPRFPAPIQTQDINSMRLGSELAAWIGFVRGDLWAERVLVDAINFIGDQDIPTKLKLFTPSDTERVRKAAEYALSSKPLNSQVWLIFSILSSAVDTQHKIANEQMKMSYYTGPNDKAVIGHRLKSVMRLRMLDDLDVREAVRREIRTILLRAPELRPAVTAAYHEAQPRDREFIETTVSATDPKFVAVLRAAQP